MLVVEKNKRNRKVVALLDSHGYKRSTSNSEVYIHKRVKWGRPDTWLPGWMHSG